MTTSVAELLSKINGSIDSTEELVKTLFELKSLVKAMAAPTARDREAVARAIASGMNGGWDDFDTVSEEWREKLLSTADSVIAQSALLSATAKENALKSGGVEEARATPNEVGRLLPEELMRSKPRDFDFFTEASG